MKRNIWTPILVLVCLVAIGCGGDPHSKRLNAGNMHPEGSYEGVFHSAAYGRMEFTQNGESVVGLYEGERHFGKIEGTVDGDLLEFRWQEWKEDLNGKVRSTSGHGYFVYTVVEEGTLENPRLAHFLKGEWGYDSDNAGNKWEAVKFPPKSKKILKPHQVGGTSTSMDEDYDGGSSNPFGGGSAPAEGGGGESSGGGDDSSSGGGGLDDAGSDQAVEDLF